MQTAPLTLQELMFLEDILLEYSDEDDFLDVSGLDGFLTAIVSGPKVIKPSVWLPGLWLGVTPNWQSEAEIGHFTSLLFQQHNEIASSLKNLAEDFQPIFNVNFRGDEEILIVDEWCYGYMQGVALAKWPKLPKNSQDALDAIALFGLEESFEKYKMQTTEQFMRAPEDIKQAAIKLYTYWLKQRESLQ